jgi:hypothetical protein
MLSASGPHVIQSDAGVRKLFGAAELYCQASCGIPPLSYLDPRKVIRGLRPLSGSHL